MYADNYQSIFLHKWFANTTIVAKLLLLPDVKNNSKL